MHVTEYRPAARRRRNCRSQIRASVIRGYCARLAWRKAGQAYTLLYLVRGGASTSLERGDYLIKRRAKRNLEANFTSRIFRGKKKKRNYERNDSYFIKKCIARKVMGRGIITLVNGCFDKIATRRKKMIFCYASRGLQSGSFDGTRNAHLRFRSIPPADKAFLVIVVKEIK